MGCGELLCDLKARVSPTDDKDSSLGYVLGPPVAGAVRLEHLRRKVCGERRHPWHLKGASCDNDLIGFDLPVVELDDKPAILRCDRAHRAIELGSEARR